MTSVPEGLRTWIDIDRKAIRHNFGVFKKLITPRTKLMAVVKSNGYGHGLIDFSKEMEKLGADFLGVDSIVEARALRHEGIKTPILVLGYTLPELFPEAVSHDIALTVSSFETLGAIRKSKLEKPLKIHIKVDTGMHRQGFMHDDLKKVIKNFQFPISHFQVDGLFTHFASAKNPAFPHDTFAQIAEFEHWITAFREAGLKPIVHASATAGTLLFPRANYDMVRVGIGLYGLWPAKEVKAYLENRITLKPALVWKSLISEIKKLPAGTRIGYDLTEELWRDSTVAVVPVGYWHGYPRALSSIGRVLVKGSPAKVLGRVSMDMLTVDISSVRDARVGDEVIMLSQNADSPASAEGICSLVDTSWYEVITRINPLIKRIYR